MTSLRCTVCARRGPTYHPPRTRVPLCGVCYRRIYSGYDPPPPTEPSAAQVAAQIASGMLLLPDWWDSDRERGES